MASQLLRLVSILGVLVGLLASAVADMDSSPILALWAIAMTLTSTALVIVLRLRHLIEPPRAMSPDRQAEPPRAHVHIEGGTARAIRKAEKRNRADLRAMRHI